MSVYHQMGHDSQNLLWVPELAQFSGAILSPVNYNEQAISLQVEQAGENFEMIFDPQLYYPTTERGVLRQWTYFPQDVDTTDMQSLEWWNSVTDNIALTCSRIRPNSACSPALAPRVFSNAYFSLMIQIGNYFVNRMNNLGIKPIQTVVCGLNDLSVLTRAVEIASIVTQTTANTIYLVLIGDNPPRRELNNTDEIKGVLRLINEIENSGIPIIVGFSSTDFVLWKAAGASSCATGKFFNLRRFTSSRFEEPTEGGGQLPYWFEEPLLAFLRESDIIRLRNSDLLQAGLNNPFSHQILNHIDNNPGRAWLALSWRQYLYAFADLEKRIDDGEIRVSELLENAERLWIDIENNNILMEEMRNNGQWIRSWRRAITDLNL